MESRAHAIVAISFLILFSTGSVVLYFWLGNRQPENRVYEIVTAQSVDGLEPQTAVRYKGLTVGHVLKVGFDPADPDKLRIRLAVNRHAHVTHATFAQLQQEGITGGEFVSLQQNQGGDHTALVTQRAKPARIPLHPSLLHAVRAAGKRDLQRVDGILASLQKFTAAGNREHLAETVTHLDTASLRLAKLERQLQPTVQALPKLLVAMRQTLHGSRQVLAEARRVERTMRQLGASGTRLSRKLTSRTLPRLDRLSRSLDRSSRRLGQLSRELEAAPQSVLTGPPQPPPGPGEPGFDDARDSGHGH